MLKESAFVVGLIAPGLVFSEVMFVWHWVFLIDFAARYKGEVDVDCWVESLLEIKQRTEVAIHILPSLQTVEKLTSLDYLIFSIMSPWLLCLKL